MGKKGFKSAIIWYFGEKNKKVKNENEKCEFRQNLGIFWVKWVLVQKSFKVLQIRFKNFKDASKYLTISLLKAHIVDFEVFVPLLYKTSKIYKNLAVVGLIFY